MSLSDAERGLIARYAARVLKRSDVPLRSLRQLVFWLNDRTESMSFPLPAPVSKAIGQLYSSNFKAGEFEKALVSSREKIIAMLEKAADETPLPEPLQGNIALLTAALGLEPEAIPFVLLVACYTRYDQFQYFVQNVLEASGPSPKALSILLDIPQRSAEDLTTPSGALAATGLVQHSEGNELAGLAGRFNIPFRVNACLDRSYDGFAALRNAMLGLPVKSENDLGDYEQIGRAHV